MNKYKAIKVTDDGITFDSKAEHRRYCELKLFVKAGEIEGLVVHPKFQAIVNEKKVCVVELDFQYMDLLRKQLVYEDVKGVYTPVSRLKHKLLKALFPDIDLRILRLA